MKKILPDFLIIGAARSGTTSLYNYLKQHPDIYMSPLKEPHFFAFEGQTLNFRGPGSKTPNELSVTSFNDYINLFNGVTTEKAIGEASTLSLYMPEAARRIKKYLSSTVKLITILRNPIERAFSAFTNYVCLGYEPIANFAQALKEERKRIEQNWWVGWRYVHMGFYYIQLKRYFDLFGVSNIKIFCYNDFNNSTFTVLREIFQFLGADNTFIPDISQKYNVSADIVKLPFPPAVKKELIEIYHEDISQLEELIKRDLSHWLR